MLKKKHRIGYSNFVRLIQFSKINRGTLLNQSVLRIENITCNNKICFPGPHENYITDQLFFIGVNFSVEILKTL